MRKGYHALAVAVLVSTGAHAFVPLRARAFVRSKARRSCPPFLPRKHVSIHSASYHARVMPLFAENIQTKSSSTRHSIRSVGAPSGFFLTLTAALGKLIVDIQQSKLPIASLMGILSLYCVTIAVCYDNFIVGIGRLFDKNDKRLRTLQRLSYPRFFLHFVGVPFLYTTSLEIGRAAGVTWLQSDAIHTAAVAVATLISVISTAHFLCSAGIVLADTSGWPPNALACQLTWFTYAKQEFLYYVAPSIILSFWSILVRLATAPAAPGIWLKHLDWKCTKEARGMLYR